MVQTNSLFYVIQGLSLLTKPGVKRFVAIPLLLNIILFSGLLLLSHHYYHLLATKLLAGLPHWLLWLGWILGFLFFAGFFIVFIFAFTTLSNIIGAPFNSLLSEKVELYLTGQKPPDRSFSENIRDIPRILGRQLAILGYYLPRALILLILLFIPVVHFFAVIFWFLFNAWFMTLQYIDYPADNHRLSFKDMHLKLKEKMMSSLGFGTGVLLLSMVPVLNFIAMPAAVSGATKYWIDHIKGR